MLKDPSERARPVAKPHPIGLRPSVKVARGCQRVDSARCLPRLCFIGKWLASTRSCCRTNPTRECRMMRLLIHWLLSAIALLVVAHLVPGFHVHGLLPALVAALVIGLLNATLGLVLKILTFPISILTLGLFLLVINGMMILLASSVVRGFYVNGMVPAFF